MNKITIYIIYIKNHGFKIDKKMKVNEKV